MNLPARLPGSCHCGAIRFEAELPSLWCAHCHCVDCRKAHGAGYVTWVGFAEDEVHLLDGESTLAWYRSSQASQRGFCRNCGSTLFFRSDRWAGEWHIAAAVFDGPLDRKPQANVYVDESVDWIALDHSLSARQPET